MTNLQVIETIILSSSEYKSGNINYCINERDIEIWSMTKKGDEESCYSGFFCLSTVSKLSAFSGYIDFCKDRKKTILVCY